MPLQELIKEANDNLYVNQEAIRSYENKRVFLVEFVDKALTARPDIYELIGNNALKMMYDNHKNHINFMINVFKFNDYEMLVSMIPWVYKAYKSHGFSYDYFPIELTAWQSATKNYLKPEDADEINNVYKWMIEKHNRMIELSQQEITFKINLLPELRYLFQDTS